MKVKKIIIAVLIVLVAGAFGQVSGKETARTKNSAKAEAKAMLKKAAIFMKESGKEKAIVEFNKPNGRFVQGALYVFAYDLNGTVIAHPKRPELLGKNLINEPDSRGKLFRKEIVEKARSQGQGRVKYMYLNPATKKEELKTTFFIKEGGVIIACGAY